MKRIFLLMTLALLTVTAAAQLRLVRLTRYEGRPITGVKASAGFEVYLVQSTQTRVVAEVREAVEEYLDLSLDAEGVVRVSLRAPSGGNNRRGEVIDFLRRSGTRNATLKLTVYLPTITRLSGSGAVDFHATGTFRSQRTAIDLSGASELESLNLHTDVLSVECNGASEIEISGRAGDLDVRLSGASDAELNLDCVTARVDAAGASDLELRGRAEAATFTVSGASDFGAREFAVKRLTVNASAASSASVWATDELHATASSAASIRYRGNPPQIDNRSSSAGSIRRVD